MSASVFRFAPSPNGRLHLGHAYSALLNEKLARAHAGRFLLRIEDIDPARCNPGFERAIIDDLGWLGLRWEEPVRRQSEHLVDYAHAVAQLRQRGLVYPCFCSRGAIARALGERTTRDEPPSRDPDGAPLYPGTCRHLPHDAVRKRLDRGEPYALRLDMAAARTAVGSVLRWTRFDPESREETVAAEPARWGDAVIVRKDIATSYHLSVVVDDAIQGITHVVRGRDLEPATDLHALLQTLLGLPKPAYLHHRLILDGAGRKLSKSLASPTLADLRAAGLSPRAIQDQFGLLCV